MAAFPFLKPSEKRERPSRMGLRTGAPAAHPGDRGIGECATIRIL
jgi:hypothetical protein